MAELNQNFAEFPTEHAFRHKMAPDSRESLAHMLMMPEQGIAGFIYPAVLGSGAIKARACLFGPGLPAPVIEEVEGKIADDMGFDGLNFGPLSMSVREPYKRVDLAWAGDRIKFSGQFEATHPAYPFSMHPKGNPPYFGDNRTEQHGRLSADVEVDGKKFHHEGHLIRDHSWGPRIWGLNQHYKWIHATTGDSSIHFFEMQSFGRTELRGFLFRDGLMRHLAAVEYDFVYDDKMIQKTFSMKVTDTDNRVSHVDYIIFASIQVDLDPKTYINTAGATITFDGVPGMGWCEFSWNKDYFDFAKSFVTRFG
ncbi:DUF7064 domain-containing protein [Sphingopyxis sp.]|uniref:DUF7064 domain-containing protein n=1 Tax=Sphingopyxis sp. TaxID=1908224 RepID=UPI003D8101F3